ncbi:MAG: bifunctional tRNA (5-methylaminomethyl-2-thiouridine)(34)-methyltransferase MnmD/FAD-dependent 5-carboxymethylaminomethyl-2-thiouridine(34) oxidoreductase MnmC, partial [Rubrivivax sp.]
MTLPAGAAALCGRWALRDEFVILEARFDATRFLRTWAGWQADPHRCQRLFYIAFCAPSSPSPAVLDDGLPDTAALAQRLTQAWPVLTPGLHTLAFDQGQASQFTLLLGAGEAGDLVPQLVARVDAFWLDGVAPAPLAPHGDEAWLSRLARLAAPGATAMASSQAVQVRAGLAQSGFKPGPKDGAESDA